MMIINKNYNKNLIVFVVVNTHININKIIINQINIKNMYNNNNNNNNNDKI